MKNFELIKQLEKTSSRISKEEILLFQMKIKNHIFFSGLRLAYDKLLTFGVKKVPESNFDGEGLSWEEFDSLTKQLISRKLTGHAARDEIIRLMKRANSQEWNYFYRRILQKDMRCGVSEKTINNVAKNNNFIDYTIPVFACQLAQDSDSHKKKLTGKKFLEVKLDGVRVISILYPNGNVDLFSRNGKELNNFNHIKDELSKIIIKDPIESALVIDGEVVSKNFQELMKQIHRKNTVQNHDAVLYLFDILPFDNFKSGLYKKSYYERTLELKEWYKNYIVTSEKIKIIEKNLIDLDTPDGQFTFKTFNKQSIVNGYEGIMIKDPDSFYECKRSTTWLKLKPVIEISLKVINYEEGTGRNSGKLGAFIAEGIDEGKFFRLNIGSGFTDEQRDTFWKERDDLVGRIIEIKADSISKSQDGETWSLRFPRFKCFRGFDKNEKL